MLTLTKDLETGVAKIDEQHKELVNRINAAITMGTAATSKEETKKKLDFLEEYVIKHFGDEESLQRQSRFPKYDQHREQHKAFIAEMKKMKEEFAANGPSAKFTVSLKTSVINWVIKHIKGYDVEFAKYYREQNP